MALVYSYIRFSSKKQAKGDSLRRQTEGEEWIERNGHTKASLTLHDLGVSAFRGKHRHSGKLRKFLDAVEEGRVKRGSILLVEHLDRLSREGVYEALPVFLQILNAGIHIAVLKPEEHIYTRPNDADEAMISVMLPLVYFYLAHLESLRKSQSLGAAWEEKRRKAQKDRTPFNKRRPAWISWDDENEEFVLNDGAQAIRFIFEQTTLGLGQRKIVQKLQESFSPIGLSGKWNSSYVQKVLSDRAVIGEFQPYTRNDEGERVPDGPPISDYYPAVLSESEFLRAEVSKEKRTKQKGPSSQFVNLFVGLVKNAHDRQPMHIQPSIRKNNGEETVERRLVSYGHIRHIDGADSVSVPYEQFEQAILSHLSELSPSELIRTTPTDDGLDDLQELLEGIEIRLRELEAILTDPMSPQKPAALTSAIGTLEQQREDVRHRIHKAKKDREVVDPLGEIRSVVDLLSDVSEEDTNELRLRIRSKIADLIDEIIVKPEKHFGRVWVHVQVCYSERYSCKYKSLSFGPNFLSAGHREIDLDSKDDCEKVIFAELAAQQSQACQVGFQGEVPGSVGEAGKAWLQHARSKMARQSFRVVPSKIARFVEFMGADSGVSEIDHKRWDAWCDWLKREIESGRLSFSTARVTYSRAREMVIWLGEQGKIAVFDSLSLSARLALS